MDLGGKVNNENIFVIPCNNISIDVMLEIYDTISSGCFAPLLLAPAEGLGVLWTPWDPAGPAGGLLPPVGLQVEVP